jgi:hypothetical protein
MGVEVGGKITVASMTSTLKAVVKTTVDVGLACPGGNNCSVVKAFGPLEFSGVPTFDVPSLNDFRFEPTVSAYTFVKASIGNPFLASLRFDAFKVKAGAALKGNFAPQRVQAGDTQYSSDYKLVSELKAGADTGFTGLAGFLGLNAFAEAVLEISSDLGTTPTGTVSADVAQFNAGDTFNVEVKLDPLRTGFLPLVGPYNVERVVLARKDATGATQEVASVTAQPDQTQFAFPLEATASGRTDEFFAFVVTRLLPTDVFSLELGQAKAPVPVSRVAGTVTLETTYDIQVSAEGRVDIGNCGFNRPPAECRAVETSRLQAATRVELTLATTGELTLGRAATLQQQSMGVTGSETGVLLRELNGQGETCQMTATQNLDASGSAQRAETADWQLLVQPDGSLVLTPGEVRVIYALSNSGQTTVRGLSQGCGPDGPFTSVQPFGPVISTPAAVLFPTDFAGAVNPGDSVWQGEATRSFAGEGNACLALQNISVIQLLSGSAQISCTATTRAVWRLERQ